MPPGRRFLVRIALAGCVFAAACGREIGDDCETNVQCSAQGDRQCDISQPGGYCTVEGCDRSSCPDSALCVRFFPPEALTVSCDPTEVRSSTCAEREICLAEGFCVEVRLEHRFCMKPCGSDGDCREGYQCRSTGTLGAELLPGPNGEPPKVGRFCTATPVGSPPDAGPRPDAPTSEGGAVDAPADAGVDAPLDGPDTDA
jgi:hypothetical protein